MNLQVDTADFEKQIGGLLRELQEVTGQTAEEVIIDESKLFALEALNLAPRKGNKASVLKDHKKDVAAVIQASYISQDQATRMLADKTGYMIGKGRAAKEQAAKMPFKRFENFLKGQQYAKAQELLNATYNRITSGSKLEVIKPRLPVMQRMHDQQRKRGRRRDVIFVIPGRKSDFKRLVKALTKKNTDTVGSIKKPWADIASKLTKISGKGRAPAKSFLAAKGKKGFVSVKKATFRTSPFVKMWSNSRRAGEVNYNRAFQARAGKIRENLDRQIERKLKKKLK